MKDLEAFNFTASRLYKWLLFAIDNRKQDIIRRRALT